MKENTISPALPWDWNQMSPQAFYIESVLPGFKARARDGF